MDVYSSGNVNNHRQSAYFGYCDNVAAGSHTLAVYVSSTPGYSGVDCFTGWNTQSWLLGLLGVGHFWQLIDTIKTPQNIIIKYLGLSLA